MASGLITPIAVAMVYATDGYVQKNWSPKNLLVIFVLLITAAAGYFTMPYVPGHNFLHAQNMTEMLKTTIRIMDWPLADHKLHMGLLWLPTLITMPLLLFTRRFTRCDLLMFGCFIWTGAQVLALAFGRGHDLFEVSSQYTDILLPGLAGNAWFVIRATEVFFIGQKFNFAVKIVGFLFFAALFFSYKKRFPNDIETMKNDRAMRLIQTQNVRLYLKTRDRQHLEKPRMHIPYPNSENFQKILDQPGLMEILPQSVLH